MRASKPISGMQRPRSNMRPDLHLTAALGQVQYQPGGRRPAQTWVLSIPPALAMTPPATRWAGLLESAVTVKSAVPTIRSAVIEGDNNGSTVVTAKGRAGVISVVGAGTCKRGLASPP